jgi:hypothetical protein
MSGSYKEGRTMIVEQTRCPLGASGKRSWEQDGAEGEKDELRV